MSSTSRPNAKRGSKRLKQGALRNITPALPKWERRLLASFVSTLTKDEEPANALRAIARRWADHESMVKFCAVALVVADLVDHGWVLKARKDELVLKPSTHVPMKGESVSEAKDRLRVALQIGRDRQLEEPSVQAFLRRIETPTATRRSVLDLVSDGAVLAKQLAPLTVAKRSEDLDAFRSIIDPAIEICESGSTCETTGIKHLDIWRYFRHTWSLEYRPVPGRAMPILIRNRALKYRPVIGIAMLASPVMKMKARDEWLGWSTDTIDHLVATRPDLRGPILDDLKETLEAAIGAIRSDDLISKRELRKPDRNVVFKLERLASGASARRDSELRQKREDGVFASRGDVSSKKNEGADWRKASEDPLFVKKRAETLAKLLEAWDALCSIKDADGFADALLEKPVRRAVLTAVREKLKMGVSSEVMDVSVCGAVPPYNDLLVGKLVALLVASREVQDAYRNRYGQTPSIIASQMAGRPIFKPAELKVLTTTSLYGHSSSQYNRLRLRAGEHPGLDQDTVWEKIARTDGFGSIHLSADTVASLRDISAQQHGMRRINSRFGEGTNPRMRQIREGLDTLGIPSDAVLEHASKRILYGCRLDSTNSDLPFAFGAGPARAPDANALFEGWVRRWALPRIGREGVLDRLRSKGPVTVQDTLWRNPDGQYRLDLSA